MSDSTPVYYLGIYDIDDTEAFAGYPPVVRRLLAKYGAEVLAMDLDPLVLEGSARKMNAIIRFPSKEAALALYADPEYREAKSLRQRVTSNATLLLLRAMT